MDNNINEITQEISQPIVHITENINENQQPDEQVQQLATQMQDNQQQLQRQLNEQKAEQLVIGVIACQLLCMVTFQALYGYLFYFFSTNEEYYGGSECVKLRGATYFMGVGILLLSAVQILFVILGSMAKSPEILGSTTVCFEPIFGLFNFILWIVILVALSDNEPCGSLRTLVLVFLWLMIIGLVLTCSSLCCMLCLAGISVEAQGQHNNRRINYDNNRL